MIFDTPALYDAFKATARVAGHANIYMTRLGIRVTAVTAATGTARSSAMVPSLDDFSDESREGRVDVREICQVLGPLRRISRIAVVIADGSLWFGPEASVPIEGPAQAVSFPEEFETKAFFDVETHAVSAVVEALTQEEETVTLKADGPWLCFPPSPVGIKGNVVSDPVGAVVDKRDLLFFSLSPFVAIRLAEGKPVWMTYAFGKGCAFDYYVDTK